MIDSKKRIIRSIIKNELINQGIKSIDNITRTIFSQKNDLNSNDEKVLTEFLFQCLDVYGKDASILFSNIDFFKKRDNIIKRLHENYKDKFDFDVIKASLFEISFKYLDMKSIMTFYFYFSLFLISILLILFQFRNINKKLEIESQLKKATNLRKEEIEVKLNENRKSIEFSIKIILIVFDVFFEIFIFERFFRKEINKYMIGVIICNFIFDILIFYNDNDIVFIINAIIANFIVFLVNFYYKTIKHIKFYKFIVGYWTGCAGMKCFLSIPKESNIICFLITLSISSIEGFLFMYFYDDIHNNNSFKISDFHRFFLLIIFFSGFFICKKTNIGVFLIMLQLLSYIKNGLKMIIQFSLISVDISVLILKWKKNIFYYFIALIIFQSEFFILYNYWPHYRTIFNPIATFSFILLLYMIDISYFDEVALFILMFYNVLQMIYLVIFGKYKVQFLYLKGYFSITIILLNISFNIQIFQSLITSIK